MLVYQATAKEDWNAVLLFKQSIFREDYSLEKAAKDANYIVDLLIHCFPDETLDEIACLLETELHARKWVGLD